MYEFICVLRNWHMHMHERVYGWLLCTWNPRKMTIFKGHFIIVISEELHKRNILCQKSNINPFQIFKCVQLWYLIKKKKRNNNFLFFCQNTEKYEFLIYIYIGFFFFWMKGCILPFPNKGDHGLAKNYRGITLTSIAAKIYNAPQGNRIEPKIDNILRKN